MIKPALVAAAVLGTLIGFQYVLLAHPGGDQPQDVLKASLALNLSSTAGLSDSPSRLVFHAISDADVEILPAIGSFSTIQKST
jgi:hypothetical protein